MAVEKLNPIAWTEGMFLRPQHLQYLDQAADGRLFHHLRTLDPFHWGVRELQIDEEALSDCRIVIQRLNGILPGGTIIRHPGNALVQSRKFDPASERLNLYLGLRQQSPNEANTAPADNGDLSVRYLVRTENVPDLNRPGFENSVELISPNVRLLISGEEPELEIYDSFKLAEIHATGDSARPFEVSPTYAPPLLAIQAWQPLNEEIDVVVNQMSGKVRQVAAGRDALTGLDFPRMLMWYTIARLTPVLRHLLSTGHTHPFDLYSALIETAASLGAMGHEELIELPDYDHENLYACYHALIDFINVEIQREFKDRSVELKMPFIRGKKLYATDELNMELADKRNAFYLAIKAEMDSQELVALVTTEGLAASIGGLEFLLRMKVRGLRLEQLPAAPADVKPSPGFQYFRIDPHSNANQWKKVMDDYNFGVSLGKLEGADVRLVVVVAES